MQCVRVRLRKRNFDVQGRGGGGAFVWVALLGFVLGDCGAVEWCSGAEWSDKSVGLWNWSLELNGLWNWSL